MLADFRAFLVKSNALALAIGVIIGAALGAVVNSLVKDIIMPPVGLALGGVDFSQLKWVLNPDVAAADPTKAVSINYGAFINTVINLVITGLVLFMIVKVYDAYQNRKRATGEEGAGTEPDEQVMLLREIRDALITRA